MDHNEHIVSDRKIIVRIDKELEDLIPGYIENRYKDIRTIENLLEIQGYEDIRIIGHSMKGSGGGYGFERITEIGRSIEQAAKENNDEEIRRQVKNLTSYIKEVEIVYE